MLTALHVRPALLKSRGLHDWSLTLTSSTESTGPLRQDGAKRVKHVVECSSMLQEDSLIISLHFGNSVRKMATLHYELVAPVQPRLPANFSQEAVLSFSLTLSKLHAWLTPFSTAVGSVDEINWTFRRDNTSKDMAKNDQRAMLLTIGSPQGTLALCCPFIRCLMICGCLLWLC